MRLEPPARRRPHEIWAAALEAYELPKSTPVPELRVVAASRGELIAEAASARVVEDDISEATRVRMLRREEDRRRAARKREAQR